VKIVADENVDKEIVDRLRADGHDVLFIAQDAPGIDDQAALDRSRQTGGVLLTADKDFGDLVFRQRLLHSGVLLVRLAGVGPDMKAGLVAATFDYLRSTRERIKFRIRRAVQTQFALSQIDPVAFGARTVRVKGAIKSYLTLPETG
jgi:predicted nuclease of predicted toxin-antitoxin system